MINIVMIRVRLRPTRSPMWPKIRPPTGRATKPIAKVAKASRVPTTGSSLGKNSLLKTVPAATP